MKDASDLLKPYILRDVSDGNSGELHPWALDSIAYGYFLYTGLHAESTGDVATATDAYVRAAELGLRHHEALDSLADLIADGLVVDDFEKLIDKAYAAWAEDWSETLRLIRLSPNDDYVRRRSRKIAETHDTFASIYGRGTSNLEKVVTLLEKAVEYDAQNAKYRLRLAEAYFANSQAERAIESAEKAIELKPDFRKASQAIEKYRSAASE